MVLSNLVHPTNLDDDIFIENVLFSTNNPDLALVFTFGSRIEKKIFFT